MPRPLAEVLTESTLRKLAGPKYFERGEEYCDAGAVRALETKDGVVSARVQGTHTYKVRLRVESGQLGYECSCPLGGEGTFCKHAVAVGLTWLGKGKEGDSPGKFQVSLEDIRGYLEGRDKKELVDLVADFAAEDGRLFDRLALRAAQSGGATPDLKRYWNALRKAIEIRDFVDWNSAYEYSNKVEDAIETLRTLIESGHARAAVDLAEYAWELLEESQNSMDDSGGHLTGLAELLEGIHHEACRQAQLHPADVAARLFRLEVESGLGAFYDATERYADVLGREGKLEYERLARAAWKELPTLGPDEKEERYSGRRYQLTSILERIAKRSGDPGALIEIKKRDLSRPWAFLQIVEICRQAGNHDEALKWAERGVRTFDGHEGDALREALSWEYHRRGRHREAMDLSWRAFLDRPWLESYQGLKKHADSIKNWPEWRGKALAVIRAEVSKGKQKAVDRDGWGRDADASTLVEILLWEEDVEAAWSEAKVGGCRDGLWLALAEAREEAHPEDALPIHQRHLEVTLRHADKQAYYRVVEILRTIKRVMTRVGRGAEFAGLVRKTREENRRRKNLVAILDEAKLTEN
jgi:uncharacterized Zn finger protein